MKTENESKKICESCGRRKRKDEFSAGRRVCKACRAERERERLRESRAELLTRSPDEVRWAEQTRRRRELLGVGEGRYRLLVPRATRRSPAGFGAYAVTRS
jgi:hypothetical protein